MPVPRMRVPRVQVCHPKVRENIALDFRCFLLMARIAEALMPSLRWIDVVGTCHQFIRHLSLQAPRPLLLFSGATWRML